MIISVGFHLADPHIGQPILKNIAYLAVLYPAAGINVAVRQDRYMAVAAVAATVDHAFLSIFRDLKLPGFICIQCPKVILLIKIGFTSGSFVCLKLPVAIL